MSELFDLAPTCPDPLAAARAELVRTEELLANAEQPIDEELTRQRDVALAAVMREELRRLEP